MPEPLTVAQAKQHLNIPASDTTWDQWFEDNIPAARIYVEGRCDHILVEREFTEYRYCFGTYLELMRRPISAIGGIDYVDTAGDEQTFADYSVNLNRHPARLYASDSWPSIGTNSEIGITYTAGIPEADWETNEDAIRMVQAIKLLLAGWFAVRETHSVNDIREVPHSVDALCDQVRGEVV